MRMTVNTIFLKVAVAVMAFCSFVVPSCDGPEPAVVTEVSSQYSEVSYMKGSMFVSVMCKGDWTLSLQSDGGEVDWAELSHSSGTGNKTNVLLRYQENTTGQSRTLTIVVDDGAQWSTCQVTQFSGEELPDDGGDDDDGNEEDVPSMDLTRTGWLELPAMDDPDLGYYAHRFEMSGRTYRNYSFGWSQDDRVAIWVAYPLCNLYINGSVGRTNAWALDPLLGELSAAPFGGYCGSYARGHQIPSADRQCSYDANAQTFYGTNMTPQLNAHNEGIWSDLEGKVRNIAKGSDTTYVVTGVIVSPGGKKERDSNGKNVTVPDAYFKVLLRYSKSSTLGQWAAAAFYLEHRAYSERIGKEHSMSVDALEDLTGLDFFVNLPAQVGDDMAAKLESQDPKNSSVWW